MFILYSKALTNEIKSTDLGSMILQSNNTNFLLFSAHNFECAIGSIFFAKHSQLVGLSCSFSYLPESSFSHCLPSFDIPTEISAANEHPA